MLNRRDFMAVATLPLFETAPAQAGLGMPAGVPETASLGFAVMRSGSKIGEHLLQFAAIAGGFNLTISVDILVKFGPIPVFRYSLRGTEQWHAGQCQYAAANANDDGKNNWMRAEHATEGLWVQGSRAAKYLAPANALPATHWNKTELKGPWINIQNGQLLRPHVTDAGPDPVRNASGGLEPARRYVMSGDARLTLWYSGQEWSGLGFTARDGSAIRYEKL
ncbi:MAG: DUF6134 family protein [Acidocella sp.]|nr:DUF6134 family protein [Acidocella sp.]